MLVATNASASTAETKETIEADVSTRTLSITSGFSGTEILVFGTVENSLQPSAEAGTYDVIVVAEGKPTPLVVRRKARVGGLWLNAQSLQFASLPSYYAIASTRPIDEIAEASLLDQLEIGFGHVRVVPVRQSRAATINPDELAEFKSAIVRLKQRDNLYKVAEYGVTFIGRSLFRSTISLPPNVPIGPVTARIYLFREGHLLSQFKSRVTLEREGIERFLHEAAFRRPLLYGIASIMLAVAAGFAASFAFSRRLT